MPEYFCSNCGAPVTPQIRTTKMVSCVQCDTTLYLADEGFRLAGKQGVMQDTPTLLKLGERAVIDGENWEPIGHARYSYGRGWWDEFWCIGGDTAAWISVDEGDIAIERPLAPDQYPRGFTPRIGAIVGIGDESFRVTEAETAECIALRGEFPELLSVGDRHNYFDLTGEYGGLATYETWDNEELWHLGRWVDPWRVRAA